MGELARRLELHSFSSLSNDKMTTNTSGGSRPSDKGMARCLNMETSLNII